MPSPGDRPSLCIVGDSHLGSVRHAERDGLLDLSGYDVEYWGARGPAYRDLIFRNDQMEVRSDAARAEFADINHRGRTTIGPQDMDEFLFYGGRIRSYDFFGAHLQRQLGEGMWQSRAALAISARSFLMSSRTFRIAAIFARDFGAKVSFVTTPFLTDGITSNPGLAYFVAQFPAAIGTTAEDREWIWCALEREALAVNVNLVRQPEETIVQGVLTSPEYAIDNAQAASDADHKSPAFAALMLSHWNGRAPAAV
ncbi:MAG: hypothetical protein AB3N23_03805 [Paracoccaceae bacterium]